MLLKDLCALPAEERPEVIVVDGGSTDGTAEAALRYIPKVYSTSPGRARQMNLGAAAASGEVLLFLHADSRIGGAALKGIPAALSDGGCVGGAFTLRIDSPRRLLHLVAWGARVRARLGLPYGDAGLFVRSDLFRRIGGYRNLPLMEDVDLVRRLRAEGRVRILPDTIHTSPRRWEEEGTFRVTLRNLLFLILFLFGIPPRFFARHYPEVR